MEEIPRERERERHVRTGRRYPIQWCGRLVCRFPLIATGRKGPCADGRSFALYSFRLRRRYKKIKREREREKQLQPSTLDPIALFRVGGIFLYASYKATTKQLLYILYGLFSKSFLYISLAFSL